MLVDAAIEDLIDPRFLAPRITLVASILDLRDGQLRKRDVNYRSHSHEMYMKAPRARLDYNGLVDQWRAIVVRSISTEAKQVECMAVLRDYVDSMAWRRIRGTNRPLRFYADMLVLREQLFMTLPDELCQVAIIPAYRHVDHWLVQNSVA